MIESGEGIDWATAEALAFGTLVDRRPPGPPLAARTSSAAPSCQRHSVLYDQETDETYTPLNNLGPTRRATRSSTRCSREEAVLGFEYGYSLAEPKALTLWEAQFGDFANGAQVVIDQFISSGERKWFRMSGLVMLLPHGYEGQGPEHSSARLERYLQLCAEDNMQVANCTTPANYFHVLRRQMTRDFRKPLVLMTPKSLLRHKRAISALAEMGPESCFHRLLWDDAEAPGAPKTTIKLARRRARSAASSSARARSTTTCSRSARSAASTTSTCCASSSSIRSRPRRCSTSSAASRRPRSSGARKSPRTWAPGPSSSPISTGCSTRWAARHASALYRPPGLGLDGDRPDAAPPCSSCRPSSKKPSPR